MDPICLTHLISDVRIKPERNPFMPSRAAGGNGKTKKCNKYSSVHKEVSDPPNMVVVTS